MQSPTADDQRLVEEVNARTGAGLELEGHSLTGKLGGALFVRWPGGRGGVVTTFPGTSADADRLASVLNRLRDKGLPVPRQDLVVDLDRFLIMVQERLPSAPAQTFSTAQVDSIWAVNERFAGAAAGMAGLPDVSEWFAPGDDLVGLEPFLDHRAGAALDRILALTDANADRLAGDDVVHVDLNAANVLFDEDDRPTGVVDWNLGAYRGNRRLALVHTRFDREWFVRHPDPDPHETAAAHHLDELLRSRIEPGDLRVFWAFWLLHHLPPTLRRGDPDVIDWQLSLAESRLG